MILLAALALPLWSAACPLQSELSFDEVRQLPMLGSAADHVLFDVNDRGDLLVVWQASTTVAGGNTKQTEGVFLQRLAPDRWRMPGPSEVFLFGNPRRRVYNDYDLCSKPQVAAVGDNFLVAWPRINRNTGNGRVEAALVAVSSTGTATLTAPVPGEGYLIDSSYTSGNSGHNIGLTRKRIPNKPNKPEVVNTGVVVVPHSVRQTTSRNEYDLQMWRVDFNALPPRMTSLGNAASRVIVDSTPIFGGRVPPSVVEDDQGAVLVAYEEFLSKQRTGAATDEGRITVRRFLEKTSGQLQLNSSVVLYGSTFSQRQRRPFLVSSFSDAQNVISLSWTEFDPQGEQGKAHFYSITPGAGSLSPADEAFPNNPLYPVRSAVSALGFDSHFLVASQWSGTSLFQVIWVPSLGLLDSFPIGGIESERVYVAVWDELGAGGQWQGRIVPVSFDGPDPTTEVNSAYLEITRG